MKPLSKNLKYSQPDFYHFSEDSILLSKEIIKFIQNNQLDLSNCIDMCCGCGVIGIEVAKKIQGLKMNFLELQPEFIPYLNENIVKFKVENFKVYNLNILDFSSSEKFDLIMINPPYFDKEASRLGKDEKRSMCRSITKSDATNFLKSCDRNIKSSGYLFVVIPNSSKVWDEALTKSSFKSLKVIELAKVRVSILKNK